MDDDGERVIHAGDRFIIQAETSDFENTYRELCYIIKQPGYAKFPTEFLDNYNANE